MTQKTNYSIHSFMTCIMKLSGAELLVYALIYSFSRTGAFNGSRAYISSATGVTVRSVDRVLAKLTEKGYISRVTECGNSPHATYVANMDYARICEQMMLRGADERQNVPRKNVSKKETKCRAEKDKMSPDNQEINKEIINRSSSSSRTYTQEGNFVKYKVRSYGRDGLVSLTEEQYGYLRMLVGTETLTDYIRKLELYMLEPHEFPIRNHFKLLRKFIEEDFSLPTDARSDLGCTSAAQPL